MKTEIIVVGGGAAGLMAASILSESGHKVTIVEARERIGGRIHTIKKPFSIRTEAGAEFIHGKLPITLSLLKHSGNKKRKVSGKFFEFKKGKTLPSDFAEGHWSELMRGLSQLERDIPIAVFLREKFSHDPDFNSDIIKLVEGFDAADPEKISSFALREEWSQTDQEEEFRIDAGYQAVTDHLFERSTKAGCQMLLNTVLSHVEWSSKKIVITTSDGQQLTSEKILIALPLGVLQNERINFSPPIAEYQKAFNAIGFGGVIKFLFEFEPDFWKENILKKFKRARMVFTDAPIPTWWTQYPDKAPLLTGWLGGPLTLKVDRTTEALFQLAVKSIDYIFQERVSKHIVCWHIADWVSDPFAGGAYSYPMPDTDSARNKLKTPIDNCLFFAGEAIYKGAAMGTVEAALDSGKETAERILAGIRGSAHPPV